MLEQLSFFSESLFVFFSDLVRQVELDLEIDFIKLSSYGDAKISSGKVTVLKDINADLEDRHVLIVEDIVDTGLSIRYLRNKLLEFNLTYNILAQTH